MAIDQDMDKKIRIVKANNVLTDLNVDRRDIAELHPSVRVSYRMSVIRNAAEIIKEYITLINKE